MKVRKNDLKMNLQFFAEGDSNIGEGNTNTGDTNETGDNVNRETSDGKEDKSTINKSTFDDILKDPAYQSEFDKRVAKALETQRGKLDKEIASKIENAKTEAEKLAKMNSEQKAQYEREKRESELLSREAEITKRELSAAAKETLADKGLPIILAEVLNYSDAESCNKSIEAVEKAFQDAVSKTVDQRLKGGKAPKKALDGAQTFTKEQISAMSPEEINRNWNAIQESMKQF